MPYLSASWGPSGQPGWRSAPAGRTCSASAAADSVDVAVGDDDDVDGGELAGWGGTAGARRGWRAIRSKYFA